MRRSTRRAQTSLAEADHYPLIALNVDQPGLHALMNVGHLRSQRLAFHQGPTF